MAGVRTGGEDAGVKQETRPVPLSGPYLDEQEEALVLEVLRSGRLSLGPAVDRFEEAFAEKVGVPYAAAVSSGTAGLHLLCIAAGIAPGDEVITTPYSFAASANCFIYEGGVPVFADVDPRTLNMDPRAVEAAVTSRTKAIVAVDIFGYPCELDELRAIAERHGVALIQDSCEALGAEYKGARVGTHGPSAVFAFYPNKQITTGEGGMVTTHSEDEWRLLRSLRNQGRADSGGWLEHVRLGYNRYLPSIHLQPYMRARYGFREGMCPVSEDASSRTMALPFFTALERSAQERVAEALAAAL